MHMCAGQVVELASEDLLVTLLQDKFRNSKELLNAHLEKKRSATIAEQSVSQPPANFTADDRYITPQITQN